MNLKPYFKSLSVVALTIFSGSQVQGGVGADKAWTTYEAETMRTSGTVVGPNYAPHTIETESSAQQYVKLGEQGEFIEFDATVDANALIVRFSLPDAPKGGGTKSELTVSVNDKPARTVELSSRNAWLYGNYPFSNDPALGKPRNFYDELSVKGLAIRSGDVVRLQKTDDDGIVCSIDFADLEQVPEPLLAPVNSLSVLDFGATGDGESDDTEALRDCMAAALEKGSTIWVPAGEYKLTGDIILPSNVTIQGAGMWHTTFVGDEALYSQADRRVRFKLTGSEIHLADFAIMGALNYRNDQEANDGIIGGVCSDSTIKRIWIEHTKVGAWIYNGTNLLIEGCRFRNMLADGVNFCVGTSGSVVDNCSARGTGDDCFAIWPAASDQGYVDEHVVPGNNVIRRSTGQLTFLANGASVYGGANNRVEDCEFIDIGTGCGILISTTFPTSDDSRGIDNNFSGTTVVENISLLRCGGYDHSWAWRGSFQICMDRKSISGLSVSKVEIRDSFSDGLTVVGPGSKNGQGTLSNTRLEELVVTGVGLGTKKSHDVFVRKDAMGGLTLVDCELEDLKNASKHFTVEQE
ncbi:hypothetical protein VDG1235_741 [Verrucomicrobiia bacterium DG1235]|nr:hypothetical protein VDG1235_741 [Verrucomicrobiae bacterium DG1235]